MGVSADKGATGGSDSGVPGQLQQHAKDERPVSPSTPKRSRVVLAGAVPPCLVRFDWLDPITHQAVGQPDYYIVEVGGTYLVVAVSTDVAALAAFEDYLKMNEQEKKGLPLSGRKKLSTFGPRLVETVYRRRGRAGHHVLLRTFLVDDLSIRMKAWFEFSGDAYIEIPDPSHVYSEEEFSEDEVHRTSVEESSVKQSQASPRIKRPHS